MGGFRTTFVQDYTRGRNHITDHHTKHTAQGLVAAPISFKIGIGRVDFCIGLTNNRKSHYVGISKQPCPQTIVQIVVIIGDIVRQRCGLRLSTCMGVQFQIVGRVIFSQRIG